jgi:hypothetical protein
MPITNYSELKSSIADFLNRDDLTSTIPTFVALAEADFNRTVRHWRQEKRSTAEIDTQYSGFPNDFLEPIRFHSEANGKLLELVSVSEMQNLRFANNNTLGKPEFYAITAGEFEVYPTPDSAYSAELYYYSKLDALSDSTATNWMLTNFPDAYLYGALLHSAPYLADDARVSVWAALHQKVINDINTESERTKVGSSGRRIKIRSY